MDAIGLPETSNARGKRPVSLQLLRPRWSPAFADFGEEPGFIFLDKPDEGLIAGVFVCCCPENHFGEDGRQVHALGGQKIKQFAAVGRIRLGGDDAVVFQAAEAVGEDIGGDAFVGRKKFLERSVTANHHVADDEQGPAISQHFDGSIQRTTGAAVRGGLVPCHSGMVASFACFLQAR